MFTVLLIIIAIISLVLYFKSPYRIFKPAYVYAIVGSLGSGKTYFAVELAKKIAKKRKSFIWADFEIIIDLKKWTKSKDLRKVDILKHQFGQGDVVIIDEASRRFPSLAKKSDVELSEWIKTARHEFDLTIILTDQSIGSVDIELRRRAGCVYVLSQLNINSYFYKLHIDSVPFNEDLNITPIADMKGQKVNNNAIGLTARRCYDDRYMRSNYEVSK